MSTGEIKVLQQVDGIAVSTASATPTMTNPMTTLGDVITGGASGTPTRLAHPGAANRLLKTTSATAHGYAQLVDADVDAAAGITGSKIVAATASVSGVVTTAAQVFAGIKTFNDGIQVGTSGETLDQFRKDTVSTTWTSNGTSGGTSSAVTLRIIRVGDFVTLFIPGFSAASGTGTPTRYVSNTALPTWARPLTTTVLMTGGGQSLNSGGGSGEPSFEILASGLIRQYRDYAGSAFTVSSTCGLNFPPVLHYYVGTGS